MKCSLDSMAVCDVWSLKSDKGNLRKVEILQYFDTNCMDCISVPTSAQHMYIGVSTNHLNWFIVMLQIQMIQS